MLSLSLISVLAPRTARSSHGRPAFGAAERTLDGEDRSERIRREGRGGRYFRNTESHPAPSLCNIAKRYGEGVEIISSKCRTSSPFGYTRPYMAQHDTSLLEAALVGYQVQLAKVTEAMADIQQRLGNVAAGGVPGPVGKVTRKRRHRISAEGRARIAEAQRKRWAAMKK
jgi:hypothetical protein